MCFQLKKIGDGVSSVAMATFDQAWHTVLSEVRNKFGFSPEYYDYMHTVELSDVHDIWFKTFYYD